MVCTCSNPQWYWGAVNATFQRYTRSDRWRPHPSRIYSEKINIIAVPIHPIHKSISPDEYDYILPDLHHIGHLPSVRDAKIGTSLFEFQPLCISLIDGMPKLEQLHIRDPILLYGGFLGLGAADLEKISPTIKVTKPAWAKYERKIDFAIFKEKENPWKLSDVRPFYIKVPREKKM